MRYTMADRKRKLTRKELEKAAKKVDMVCIPSHPPPP